MYKLLIMILLAEKLSFSSSKSCEDFEKCGQCIGNRLGCVWCSDTNHSGPRCISSKDLSKTSWCSSVYNPSTKKLDFKKDLDFSSKADQIVQLKPQHVAIEVRPGDTVNFEISYKSAKDYPVDIYYLFDNSFTMSTHRNKLTAQAKQIYENLRNVSNNVRFGAGSFVEKLAMPYANENEFLPNTFNNHLSLTDQIDDFVKTVEKVNYTSNYEDPESGLDALMQAMVCYDEIKWRDESRRIIIFSTDATYHSAGDGRAVGAFKPYDMKSCFLERAQVPNNQYVHRYSKEFSLLYDYPSVSQIKAKATDKQFSIFFATLKNAEREYKALALAIGTAKQVELQARNDTTNDLVTLILDEYRGLTRNLELVPPKVLPHLRVTFSPKCKKNDNQCAIGHDSALKINASVYAKECPTSKDYTDTIQIGVVSLLEVLNVDVKVICECDCEKEGNGVAKSPDCNSKGTLQCGICKCDEGWYGKKCECQGIHDPYKCKNSKKDTEDCSARGTCSCGICTCWPGYGGKYCQDKLNECPTDHDEKICAGHGNCTKNKICVCDPGWEEKDCSCSTNRDPCIGANLEECSGNGNCKCSVCKCKDGYHGKYCELCETCIEKRCEQLKPYVLCKYGEDDTNSTRDCDSKFPTNNNVTVSIKNETEINSWNDGYYCEAILDDKSKIVYKYLDENKYTILWIQKDKIAPPPKANIWIPIGSAIGGILLLGILTVIAWKILVDMHDSREYRKFMEESKAAGYDVSENPLYKAPAINIDNPAYER